MQRQIVDFKDPASGQTLLQAFNAVQAAVNAGTAIPTQPFFENQGALAQGVPSQSLLGQHVPPSRLGNVGSLFAVGDASDTVQFMNAVGCSATMWV